MPILTKRITQFVALALTCLLGGPWPSAMALVAKASQYQLIQDGRSLGELIIEERTLASDDSKVLTALENRHIIQRMGQPFNISTYSKFIEDRKKRMPESFSYQYRLGEQESTYTDGAIIPQSKNAATLKLNIHMGGRSLEQAIPIQPERFRFPAGQGINRLFKKHYHSEPGSSFDYQTLHLAWVPQVVEMRASVAGHQQLKTPKGDTVPVTRFETVNAVYPATRIVEWRDAQGKLVASESSTNGMKLVQADTKADSPALRPATLLLRTDKNEPKLPESLTEGAGQADVIRSWAIGSKTAIRSPREVNEAVYRLTFKGTEELAAPAIPESPLQKTLERSSQPERTIQVQVMAHRPGDILHEYPIQYDGQYLQPGPLLQSDDPQIRELAQQLVKGEPRAYEAAQKLRRWVYAHIDHKDFTTGFASAKETLISGTGDCSEHAMLLAALLRAAGIPSRVAIGWMYQPMPNSEGGAFVYHMWTEAYVGREWTALDASQPNDLVDATHIKLAEHAMHTMNAPMELWDTIRPFVNQVSIQVEKYNAPGFAWVQPTVARPTTLTASASTHVNGSVIPRFDITTIASNALTETRLTNRDQVRELGIPRGKVAKGIELLTEGNAEEGVAWFRKALAQTSSSKDYTAIDVLSIGQTMAGLHAYTLADEFLAQAVAMQPDLDSYIQQWRKAQIPAQLLPAGDEARLLCAVWTKAKKKPSDQLTDDSPVAILEALQKEHPEYHPISLLLGEQYREQEDYTKARSVYQAYMQAEPASPKGPEGIAQTYLEEYKLKPAIDWLDKAIALSQRHPGETLKAMDSLNELRQRRELARNLLLLDGSANAKTTQASALLGIGKAFYGMGQTRQALQAFHAAETLNPGLQEATVRKAESLMDLTHWPSAETLLPKLKQACSTANSNQAIACRQVGRFYAHQFQGPQARQYLSKAIQVEPDNLQSATILARLFERTRQPEQAVRVLQQSINALGNKPDKAFDLIPLRYQLARLTYQTQPEQASEQLKVIQALNPLYAPAYALQGRIALAQNRHWDAKRNLALASRLSSQDVATVSFLGDWYESRFSPNPSYHAYAEAFRMAPNQTDLMDRIYKTLKAQGNSMFIPEQWLRRRDDVFLGDSNGSTQTADEQAKGAAQTIKLGTAYEPGIVLDNLTESSMATLAGWVDGYRKWLRDLAHNQTNLNDLVTDYADYSVRATAKRGQAVSVIDRIMDRTEAFYQSIKVQPKEKVLLPIHQELATAVYLHLQTLQALRQTFPAKPDSEMMGAYKDLDQATLAAHERFILSLYPHMWLWEDTDPAEQPAQFFKAYLDDHWAFINAWRTQAPQPADQANQPPQPTSQAPGSTTPTIPPPPATAAVPPTNPPADASPTNTQPTTIPNLLPTP